MKKGIMIFTVVLISVFVYYFYNMTKAISVDEFVAKHYDMKLDQIDYDKILELEIDCDKVYDIMSLKKYSSISTLSLKNFKKNDLQVLSVIPKLKFLALSNSKLTQMPDVSELRDLEVLDLSNTIIENVKYDFRVNEKLSVLRIRNCKARSLDIDSNTLKELNVQGNSISDLSDIGGLSSLEQLIADGNPVSDAHALLEMENLKSATLNSSMLPRDQKEELMKDSKIMMN